MKTRLFFLSLFLPLCVPTQAQNSGDTKAVLIGPWKIEANFTKAQKFERCSMSRTVENGLEATFVRNESGTSLVMTSPRWKLDNGKTYAVEFAGGKATWKADVSATADTVNVALTNDRFNRALRNANRFEVRGAGATLKIPLDKSGAALARLERCFENNRKAGETNPFVAPQP